MASPKSKNKGENSTKIGDGQEKAAKSFRNAGEKLAEFGYLAQLFDDCAQQKKVKPPPPKVVVKKTRRQRDAEAAAEAARLAAPTAKTRVRKIPSLSRKSASVAPRRNPNVEESTTIAETGSVQETTQAGATAIVSAAEESSERSRSPAIGSTKDSQEKRASATNEVEEVERRLPHSMVLAASSLAASAGEDTVGFDPTMDILQDEDGAVSRLRK